LFPFFHAGINNTSISRHPASGTAALAALFLAFASHILLNLPPFILELLNEFSAWHGQKGKFQRQLALL
jgi:hypothetical protein